MLRNYANYLIKKRVLVKVLSSSFLSLPVNLLVSVITLRYIDPYYMGVWAAMTIFETYANILRLGIVNGMNRELPFALGTGEQEKAIGYAQTTFAFNLFATVIIWIIAPLIMYNFELNSTYIACIMVSLGRITLNYYITYVAGTFRTTDNFNKLSNIQFVLIVSHLLFSGLIFIYGFNGYLAMQLLQTLLNAILLHLYRPFRVLPKFNSKAFVALFKTGMPLFATSYLVSIIDTIPKLFIIRFGNETMLGLYTPVLIIITAFSLLPNSLGAYYYPKLSYAFGKRNDPVEIWKMMKKVYLVSLLVIFPMILAGYFILPEVIAFFPKYKESLPFMQAALFIGPFILAKLGNLLNVVLKKINFMGYYVALNGVFQIASIASLYLFTEMPVLQIAIWSQVITSALVYMCSLLINRKVVNLMTEQNLDKIVKL
jgi:O-antigen/teichoic acid export membrane protein